MEGEWVAWEAPRIFLNIGVKMENVGLGNWVAVLMQISADVYQYYSVED